MKYVELACAEMGLAVEPIPPKDQSLNLTEKAIDIIFHAVGYPLVDKDERWKHAGTTCEGNFLGLPNHVECDF